MFDVDGERRERSGWHPDFGTGQLHGWNRKVEKVWRETNDGLGSHSHHPMYVRQERPGGKRVSEPCACVAVWCFIKANVG